MMRGGMPSVLRFRRDKKLFEKGNGLINVLRFDTFAVLQRHVVLVVVYPVTDSAVTTDEVVIRQELHRLVGKLSSSRERHDAENRCVEEFSVCDVESGGDVVEVDHGIGWEGL